MRQRLAEAQAQENDAAGTSDLAKLLVTKFAWGELSPQALQQIAAAAAADVERVSDGKCMPDLRALSEIGAGGEQPQNCFRDLMRKLEHNVRLPHAYTAKVPFKKLGDTTQHFLLPHELFAALYTEHPAAFRHSLLPNPDDVPAWWDAVQEHPQMQRHPVKDRADYKTRCLPLALHGDDVPVHGIGKGWTSKLTVFSWCSLLAMERATKEKMFMTYCTFEKIRRDDTIDAWMRILAWSLFWLFWGLWPDSGPDGVLQPGGDLCSCFAQRFGCMCMCMKFCSSVLPYMFTIRRCIICIGRSTVVCGLDSLYSKSSPCQTHTDTHSLIETFKLQQTLLPQTALRPQPERPCLPRNKTARYPPGSPEHARANTPLAGGFFAVLWGLLGDLEYFHVILKLPHFARVENFCPLCRATTTGERTWCNFRKDAPWRASVWQSHLWRAWRGRSTSAFFSLFYTSALTVSLDYLHCKYLGSDQYQFGAVLEMLTRFILKGTPEANLATIWEALQKAYDRLRTPLQSRFRYLNKLSMFIRAGYSKLRGKGGEIRHLGFALTIVFRRFMNKNLQVHREVLYMLEANNRMEKLLEENRTQWAFDAEPAMQFEEACEQMFLLQARVARHFAESGERLFDMTPKCHFLQHLAIMAKGISPRVTWCFAGEDMMQRVQTLAQSSSRGVHVTRVMAKMIRKYRLALKLQFQKLGAV